MKLLNFWPFDVAEQDEQHPPPLSMWFGRAVIVSVIAGITTVFFFTHHF